MEKNRGNSLHLARGSALGHLVESIISNNWKMNSLEALNVGNIVFERT